MSLVIRRLKRRDVDEVRALVGHKMVFSILESVETSSLSLPVQVSLYSGLLLGVLLIWKTLKYYRDRVVIPALDTRKSHHWYHIDILSHSAYCNVCQGIIVDGMYCDSCGICADASCGKKADETIRCKTLSVPFIRGKQLNHHWVQGNLPLQSVCSVCQEECGDAATLIDYRCCWCQKTVHEKECHDLVKGEECLLGLWSSMIVPPYAIRVKNIWYKGKRQLIVESLTDFEPKPDWSPLLVVANRKSGNNEGDKILRAFRSILNPAQVFDLNDSAIECALEWCRLLKKSHKNTNVRILVAGGDGTIGWVLNFIDSLGITPKPVVGILPLGTGNDLSRVLGWGESFCCETPMNELMRKIERAESVGLDRWKVKLSPGRSATLGLPLLPKDLFLNNYFSVGVDALVALNFHETRESKLYKWLGNRFVNKFLYLSFGTKDFLERKCSLLNQKIKLEMDGKKVDLPELESIVVLNIPSWGGGANIWTQGSSPSDNLPKQKINDRLIEVLGLYSTFHIGQLMIGLSEPLRLGQAKVVKIQLLDRLPIQVDGEPWLQYPTTVTITWCSQANMMVTRASVSNVS